MRKFIIFLCSFFFFLFYANLSNSAWAVSSTVSSVSYRTLEKELTEHIEQKKGTYGIYVRDLYTKQVCGLNHDTVFHAASTFKIPVNLYLFKQIADGQINPHHKLTYQRKHYEGGTGILQYKDYGTSYTIQELSKYSIVYSDNVATNMLLDLLGRKNVKKMMSDLGGTVVDYSANTTCPKDMAIYMDALVEFNIEHPAEGALLLDFLKNTVFNDRIPTLLPAGTEVAHKIGNWPLEGSYHDVGVVYHPDHPYIISLFSKNAPSSNYAYQVLQQISRFVYDAQSSFTEINLVVNGQTIDTEIPIIITNDTVYIPLLPLVASLDTGIKDPDQDSAAISDEHDVALYPDQTKMLLNNAVHYKDTPPEYIAGQLVVPQEMVTDLFPVFVNLDTEAGEVYVTNKPAVQPVEQPVEQQPETEHWFSFKNYLWVPFCVVIILICCLTLIRRRRTH